VTARCTCGFGPECPIWCGRGHETGQCPTLRPSGATNGIRHATARWDLTSGDRYVECCGRNIADLHAGDWYGCPDDQVNCDGRPQRGRKTATDLPRESLPSIVRRWMRR
jgi:hypothetical protein